MNWRQVVCSGAVLLGTVSHSHPQSSAELLVRRDYDRGIAILEQKSSARSITNADAADLVRLYLDKARLYNQMARASTALNAVFYSILEREKVTAVHSNLHAGIIWTRRKEYKRAINCLALVRGAKGALAEEAGVALVWSGLAAGLSGGRAQAEATWKKVNSVSLWIKAELAYARLRCGYPGGDLKAIVREGLGSSSQLAKVRCLSLAVQSGYGDEAKQLLFSIRPEAPMIVDSPGSLSEVRYYDPGVLEAIGEGAGYLAATWVENLHKTATVEERTQLRVATLAAAVHFERGEYQQVLDAGGTDLDVTPYYAASLMMLNRDKDAAPVIERLRATGVPEALALFARLTAVRPDDGWDGGVQCALQALDDYRRLSPKKKVIPQLYHAALGMALAAQGRHDEAFKVFSVGYRLEAQDDMAINDPQLILVYGTSTVLMKNYRILSEVTRQFHPLQARYPGAAQLSETVARIDLLTNRGAEGNSVFSK